VNLENLPVLPNLAYLAYLIYPPADSNVVFIFWHVPACLARPVLASGKFDFRRNVSAPIILTWR
jgi:hypothetical protein